MPTDLYISTDIEADGPIPGPYSMLSFGMAVAATFDGTTFNRLGGDTFYRELQPISPEFISEALAVSGLDRAALARTGAAPALAMAENVAWLAEMAEKHQARPVFVGYPLGFDWMFTYWYQVRFTGGSPFGHSAHLDLKTLFAQKAHRPIRGVGKRSMPRHLLGDSPHTHHALDDAIEQAQLFCNIFEWDGV